MKRGWKRTSAKRKGRKREGLTFFLCFLFYMPTTDLLLSLACWNSCHEYWEQRLQTERIERIRQVKEHWESQCRAFVGV
jgi:hypothetical protein